MRDPPFSRLDMVSCRNLLIYLNREVQMKVLQMFHFALRPGGYLFLGGSESADTVAEYFIPVDKKNRIYRARPTARAASYHENLPTNVSRLPEQPARSGARRQFSYAEVHHRALMRLSPPSAILDREGNIVHMSEGATEFMRMVGGEPSRNILALVRPELRLELRSALYQVQQGGIAVECNPVTLSADGGPRVIGMKVMPYHDDDSASEMIVVLFAELAALPEPDQPVLPLRGNDAVLTQLEAELQRKKEQLQETIEQSEISTEELRASNEELQAINEELRSATEELETSKEELQSVNEELITVNFELRSRSRKPARPTTT